MHLKKAQISLRTNKKPITVTVQAGRHSLYTLKVSVDNDVLFEKTLQYRRSVWQWLLRSDPDMRLDAYTQLAFEDPRELDFTICCILTDKVTPWKNSEERYDGVCLKMTRQNDGSYRLYSGGKGNEIIEELTLPFTSIDGMTVLAME